MNYRFTLNILLLSGLISLTSLGQVLQNPSFEQAQLTPWQWIEQPAGLTTKPGKATGWTLALDPTQAKTGTKSLKLTRTKLASNQEYGFGQAAALRLEQPRQLIIQTAIRSAQPEESYLWCQLWDEHQLLSSFKAFIDSKDSSATWHPIQLTLFLTPQVRQIRVGGGIYSEQGSVWFDDFQLQTTPIPAQPPSERVQAYIDSAIHSVQHYSLVSDSVAWPAMRAHLLGLAGGMQTQAQAHAVVRYLLGQLQPYGDNHSFLMGPQRATAYSAPPKVADAKEPQPQAKFLGEGIGYVVVPGFMSRNPVRSVGFATTLQGLIRQLDQAHRIKGWVVDLRQNEGGNLWPMLAGLGPLLEEGTIGYSVSKQSETAFFYREGWAYAGTPEKGRGTQVDQPYRLRGGAARVAVLIGPLTASSGEMTAIALLGGSSTRVFGQPSAGYLTGNRSVEMADGALLNIASSVVVDRLHRPHLPHLVPDERIKVHPMATADATLKAARSWLLGR